MHPPAAFRFVPLVAPEARAAVRIGVAVEGEAGTVRLVPLRTCAEADVYLGATLDANDRPIEWLEL